MKIMNVVACAAMVSLLFLAQGNNVKAADLEEVLDDKSVLAAGGCFFSGEKFLRFVAGSGLYLAPKGDFTRHVACVVFTNNSRSLNPVWLVVLGKNGKPKEAIEWIDEAAPGESPQFKSIWRSAELEQEQEPVKPKLKPSDIEI